MKLDYDLIREMLLVIEEKSTGFRAQSILSMFGHVPFGRNDDIIRYHVKYLSDAKLIQTAKDNVTCIMDITPKGREYLDSIRNQDVWAETKRQAAPVGEITFDVIKSIATNLVLGALNLK